VHEGEIVEARLAGPAAAAGGHGSRLRDTPGPAEHINFFLVLGVLGFPLDVANLRENVDCHHSTPHEHGRTLKRDVCEN
jgi:hypothetical protein